MPRIVIGLFDTHDDAAQAVHALEAAGIPHGDISIVANGADGRHARPAGTSAVATDSAATGAAVGTAVGGGAGLLAGLGLVAIPGLGPMVAAGWLAATVVGAGAGAATGGIVGALTGAGLSDEVAQLHAEGLRLGGTLVIARVGDAQFATAQSILARCRAVDVAARAQAYREAGRTRVDETASNNALIASDRVEGTAVYDPNGKHIGTISRMMIDKGSGRVAYVVMTFGGFLGMGEDSCTIPWDTLAYDTGLGGYRTGITEDQIRGAPTFSRGEIHDWSDRERERELHDYYGARYYWGP